MGPEVIYLVVFFCVAGMVGAVAFALRDMGANSTEQRLEVLTGRRAPGGDDSASIDSIVREGLDGGTNLFSGLMDRLENLGKLFEQSDSPIKPDMFFGLSIALATIGVAVAWFSRLPAPVYPVVALILGAVPLCWLLVRRRKRLKKFATQLPDALELIARALRSGHSLSSGLHVVVDEMPEPVATEFAMAYEEQNLGVSIDVALKNMLNRTPNMDLKFFVTAVAIQRQAGGDLAEILDKIGYIIRERFKIMGQVQALTGEGRMSGVVLMALPIALFFAVYYLNREYVTVLFTEPLGKNMIAFAAIMQVFGAIAIKKVIDIKI